MKKLLSARLTPYFLILPSLLFLLLVFILPVIETIFLAFRSPSGESTVENFLIMVEDLNFLRSFRNTVYLVVVVVSLQIVFALSLAMLLTRLKKGRNIYLYIWTIPLGISDLAAGLIWLSILTQNGYLNSVLFYLGLIEKPVLWLSYENPLILFVGVIIAEFWRATAVVLIILVAGVQLIPKEYSEAASVFGASAWQRFCKVTLPLLKPSLQTALILRTVLAFEAFAVVIALTGYDFRVLVGETYLWQFHYRDTGVAASYAILIFAISILASFFYLWVVRVRKVTL
jgi:multiple sugar transport system permease protein